MQTSPKDQIDRYRSHPGTGAVPDVVNSIFREAENGRPTRQCDLFEDLIENDGHLRSLIDSRVMSVAGKPYIVAAGGDADEDIEAARLLDEAIRGTTNMVEMFVHQLGARYFGFALSEILWDISERNGALFPRHFVNAPPRRFMFDDQDRPRLLTDATTWEGIPLEPGRWMFSVNGAGIVARSGLMRTATWWAVFKRMCVRDWVIFCEKFGIPFVYGRYSADANDDDIAELSEAVRDIGEAGQAVLPLEHEVKIENVGRDGGTESVFGGMTRLCNEELAKLIAGATLTTDTGGPGSYALGRVHQQRGFDLVVSDAEFLAAQFERDIGAPFCQFNGLNARPPRLKISVVRDIDPLVRAQMADILANKLGLELDEEQIRNEFQFKRPINAEGTLKGTDPGSAPGVAP